MKFCLFQSDQVIVQKAWGEVLQGEAVGKKHRVGMYQNKYKLLTIAKNGVLLLNIHCSPSAINRYDTSMKWLQLTSHLLYFLNTPIQSSKSCFIALILLSAGCQDEQPNQVKLDSALKTHFSAHSRQSA